jgi:hypothetical protein
MITLTRREVDEIKREYPPGTRIEIIQGHTPSSPIQPGEKGTVRFVDRMGTIHVVLDQGRRLGVVFPEDQIRKLE